MTIYIVLLPILLFFSIIAEKRKSFSYVFIIVVLLTIIAGFRGKNVGIDTPNYIEKWSCIADGHPELAYGFEEGFKLLSKGILRIYENYTFLFVLASFLTNYLILRRMWDFKNIASLPCMVLCYYGSYYGYTFNIVRQFLAIAVLFYFSKLLEKRKYIKYITIVLFCSIFIHQSSIICIGYIAADFFLWKRLSKRQQGIIGIGLVMTPFLFSILISRLLYKYKSYFEVASNNVGFMVFAKMAFLIFAFFICRGVFPSWKKNDSDVYFAEMRMRRATTFNYLMGLLLTGIGYFYTFMDRIGLYYMIFECIYFGMLTKTHFNHSMLSEYNHDYDAIRHNTFIFLVIIILVAGYNFITDLLFNAQGIIPYTSVIF